MTVHPETGQDLAGDGSHATDEVEGPAADGSDPSAVDLPLSAALAAPTEDVTA